MFNKKKFRSKKFLNACRKADEEAYKLLIPRLYLFLIDEDTFSYLTENANVKFSELLLSLYSGSDRIVMEENHFISSCIYGKIEDVKFLLPFMHDTPERLYWGFECACSQGYAEIANMILPYLSANEISEKCWDGFRLACENGYTEVVKLLLPYLSENDIKKMNNHSFRCACVRGHVEVAKLLLPYHNVGEIKAKNNYAFLSACRYNRLDIIKLLLPYMERSDIKKGLYDIFGMISFDVDFKVVSLLVPLLNEEDITHDLFGRIYNCDNDNIIQFVIDTFPNLENHILNERGIEASLPPK